MTISVTFQPQFTWRKLGYLYFTNSLDYRTVLEENPQWKVTELPPLGAQLRITPTATNGGQNGLRQGSFILNDVVDDTDADAIFPFETNEAYDEALNKYTLQGVIDREKINGITFDSRQAITGIQ